MTSMNRRDALKGGILGTAAAAFGAAGAASARAEESSRTHVFDVVIVGSGCAGLAAAIEAADKGATVALLEKMSMPFGNTIYAGGIFNATNTSVQKEQGLSDSVDAFYADMMKVSQNRGDAALTRVFAEESGAAIEWLRERCGIKFKKIVKEVWPGLVRGHVVDGPKKPGGAQLVTQLLEIIRQNPKITYFTNTKVIELLKTPTLECTGVRAVSKKEGEIVISARGGVLMATGGFHANKEMVCKYMGGGVAWMPLRGSPYMMGENVELTRPFFPYYMNMDQFHGGPIHGPTQANPSTLVNYGVTVGTAGTRIINEAKTYVEMAKELPLITRDNWAYIVIDSAVLENDTVATRLDRYRSKKAPIYQGSTFAELARAIGGMDEKVFVKTLEDYNTAVKAGKAAQMSPANTLTAPRLIEKAPFLALPFQGGMTATFGGPRINAKGQVINAEPGPLRRRQRHRRALLLELHRRLAAHGRRDLRAPCGRRHGRAREGEEGLITSSEGARGRRRELATRGIWLLKDN